MRRLISRKILERLGAIYIATAVFFIGAPISVSADVTAVDIKAEGSDGPVNITSGNSFSFTWTSTGATACQLTSPSGVSGVSVSGSDGPVGSSHPWYPAVGSSVTLTLNCTDGVNNMSDSVTINIVAASSGGGGGGGGGSATTTVTADIDANGSDGPVTITSGNSYSITWTSTGATACQLTSPSGVSGVSLSGSDGPVNPGHPWYPGTSTPTTLTLNCTNGSVNTSDSVVINLGALVPAAVTADIDANGSDGPVTITDGNTYSITWTSTGATA